MSGIPDTNEVRVAMIAAAWNLSQQVRSRDVRERKFEATLERFLLAYKAVGMAVGRDLPGDIDVSDILKRMGQSKQRGD